ncbi:Hypothetical protein NTJ_00247 [Nesidiocoris tenuis]|uniref:Uncharacterized protein n=1 Tax=Nesidiocoris tenuis TaxID=355587 RepID=A0ABN7A5H4_9HEMI|nr:Hypothetical protein NTJ_00247 [Nesidiocoris tenuis]
MTKEKREKKGKNTEKNIAELRKVTAKSLDGKAEWVRFTEEMREFSIVFFNLFRTPDSAFSAEIMIGKPLIRISIHRVSTLSIAFPTGIQEKRGEEK